MSILDQRVIFHTTDISTKVASYIDPKADFAYTAGQYLYIGSILPFNNLWFEMGHNNAVGVTTSVEMYFGNAWVSAVDIIDETVGLTGSGRIQWNTDLNKGWDLTQYSSDLPGFSTNYDIYNMYWVRLSWNLTLTASTKIQYIGQKFSSDTELFTFYPDLNNSTMMTNYASGKSSWSDQHFMAADHIVRDLIKRGIIKSRSQILDYSLFIDASCHRVAEIVYTAFGPPYSDLRKGAHDEYEKAINLKYFKTDKNADARLDPIERKFTTSFSRR